MACCWTKLNPQERHVRVSKVILLVCTAMLVHLVTVAHMERHFEPHAPHEGGPQHKKSFSLSLCSSDSQSHSHSRKVHPELSHADDELLGEMPNRRMDKPAEAELQPANAAADPTLPDDDEMIEIDEIEEIDVEPEAPLDDNDQEDLDMPPRHSHSHSHNARRMEKRLKQHKCIGSLVHKVALGAGIVAAFCGSQRSIRVWIWTIALSNVVTVVLMAHRMVVDAPAPGKPHCHAIGKLFGAVLLHLVALVVALRFYRLTVAADNFEPSNEFVVIPSAEVEGIAMQETAVEKCAA